MENHHFLCIWANKCRICVYGSFLTLHRTQSGKTIQNPPKRRVDISKAYAKLSWVIPFETEPKQTSLRRYLSECSLNRAQSNKTFKTLVIQSSIR